MWKVDESSARIELLNGMPHSSPVARTRSNSKLVSPEELRPACLAMCIRNLSACKACVSEKLRACCSLLPYTSITEGTPNAKRHSSHPICEKLECTGCLAVVSLVGFLKSARC